MIAMSALSYFLIGISIHNSINIIYTIAMLFFITGVVASSRLQMKAHTFEELIIGYFAGMLPQLMLWIFWL
jgi:membrane-associated phospholipid phosphatase